MSACLNRMICFTCGIDFVVYFNNTQTKYCDDCFYDQTKNILLRLGIPRFFLNRSVNKSVNKPIKNKKKSRRFFNCVIIEEEKI